MLRAVVNALASEHESAVAGDRDPGDANVAANRATVLKGEDALYAADVALVEQLAHPLPARWPHTVRPQSAGRTRGGVARTARATTMSHSAWSCGGSCGSFTNSARVRRPRAALTMDSAALERERAHSRAMKAKKMGERTWDADKEPVTKGRGTAFAREPGSIGRAPDSRGGGSAATSSGGRGWRDGDAHGSSPQAAATSRPATAERPKRPERPELGIYMSPAARARKAVAEGEAAAKAAEAEAQALAREQAAAEKAKAKAAEEEQVLAEIQAAADRMEAVRLAAPAAAAPAAAAPAAAAPAAASGKEPWQRSWSARWPGLRPCDSALTALRGPRRHSSPLCTPQRRLGKPPRGGARQPA